MRVDQVMTRDVLAVSPATSLKEAAPLFTASRISGLPVVDEGRLVGVLSESDIVAKETSGYEEGAVSAQEERHLRRERAAETVGEAMATDVVTTEPWESVWAAADRMIVHGVHRLPVVSRGRLVGIVTRTDLIRAFARSDGAVEHDVREQLLPSVGLDPQALDVQVERGVVTLAGAVPSDLVADCLHATVHLVPGVVRVEWLVEVREPTAARG